MSISGVSLVATEPYHTWLLASDAGPCIVQLSTVWIAGVAQWTNPVELFNGPAPANYEQAVTNVAPGAKFIVRASGDNGSSWVYSEPAFAFGLNGLEYIGALPSGFRVSVNTVGESAVVFQASEDAFFSSIAASVTIEPSGTSATWDATDLREEFDYYVRSYAEDYPIYTDAIQAHSGNTVYSVSVSNVLHDEFTLKWYSGVDDHSIVDISDDDGETWTNVFDAGLPVGTQYQKNVTGLPASAHILYRITDDTGDEKTYVSGAVNLRGVRSIVVEDIEGTAVRVTVSLFPATGESLQLSVQWDDVDTFASPTVITNGAIPSGGVYSFTVFNVPYAELRYYRASIDNYTHSKSTSFRKPGIWGLTLTPDYTSVLVAFHIEPAGTSATLYHSFDDGVTWTQLYSGTPQSGYYEYTDDELQQGTAVKYKVIAAGVTGEWIDETQTLGVSWETLPEWSTHTPRLRASVIDILGFVWGTPIVDVSYAQGNTYFKVAKEYVTKINEGDTFRISGSTGNDGTYTAVSVSQVNNEPCEIMVAGAVVSAVADGYLQTYEDTDTLVVDVADNAQFTDAVNIFDAHPLTVDDDIHWDDGNAGEVYYVRAKYSDGPYDVRQQRLPGVYNASAEGVSGQAIQVEFDIVHAHDLAGLPSVRLLRSGTAGFESSELVFSDDMEEGQTHVVLLDDNGGNGLEPDTGYYYRIYPHKTDTAFPYVDVAVNTLLQAPKLAGVAATQGTVEGAVTLTYTNPGGLDAVDAYMGSTNVFAEATKVAEDQTPGEAITIEVEETGRRHYFWLVAKIDEQFPSPPSNTVMGWCEVGTEYVLKSLVVQPDDIREGVRQWEPDGEIGTLTPGTVDPGDDNTITARIGLWYPGSAGVTLKAVTARDVSAKCYANGAVYAIARLSYTEEAFVQASDISTIHYTLQRWNTATRAWVNMAGHTTVALSVQDTVTLPFQEDIALGDTLNFRHILGATTSPFTEVGVNYRLTYRIKPTTSPVIYLRYAITTV